MKKMILNSKQCLLSFLAILFVFLLTELAKAQITCPPNVPNPCPPQLGQLTSNPCFPGCQAPGADPFRVLLVLDESNSIASPSPSRESNVEDAVNLFASTLHSTITVPGRVQMGIVEFHTTAATVIPMTDVTTSGPGGIVAIVSNYLSANDGSSTIANYDPDTGLATNFSAALNQAATIPGVDIIIFITDGNPFPSVSIDSWRNISNTIKCAGTYVFALGIGNGISDSNLQNLSGFDQMSTTTTLLNGADWAKTDFTSLPSNLATFANSLLDLQAPVVTCSPPVTVNNDPGKCGSNVSFSSSATDNCGANLSCSSSSGNFFPVGQTTVTCKAIDNVGNTATCTFKITVLDLEPPHVVCPAPITISCEESLDPSNTGSPSASDNCSIGGMANSDVRVNGNCPNQFTINRTWNVMDIHGNGATCLQTISVQDKKPPVITCPANITVTCDTSIPKTGMATATDNCDASVSITNQDIHVSGDCDWFCIIERHWTATDDCGNFSKCVQVITKDVTPLIEKALEAGPLVWGQPAATVTLPPGKGACVVKWLPYVGTVPTALKFDDAVAGAECTLMTNPLDRVTGQIVNPLLGEAMKLKILVRLNPSLGTRSVQKILRDNGCPAMHFIVKQNLGGQDPNVNELLRVTDLTLGNVNVSLLVPEHCLELLKVLKCVNQGRSVCNNP